MEIAENRFAVEVEGFECSVHVLIVHFETGFLKGKFNVIAVPEVGADDLHTGGGDGATLKVRRRAGEGIVVGAVTPVPGLLIVAVGDDELAAAVGHLVHHERVIAVAVDGDVLLLPSGDFCGLVHAVLLSGGLAPMFSHVRLHGGSHVLGRCDDPAVLGGDLSEHLIARVD